MEMERLEEDSSISFKRIGNRKTYILIALVAIVAGFIIGILVGVYGVDRTEDGHKEVQVTPAATSSPPQGTFLKGVPARIIQDGDPTITEKIIKMMKPENIRENLRNLTSKPHLAGTPADKTQAEQLVALWKSLEFDETQLTPYNILLSYPNETDPNIVSFIDENGQVKFRSTVAEKILTDKENKTDVVLPFNSYSPKGDIRGDLVYVNYARIEDFAWLKENTTVNVTGKIVIARYGKIFRGDKVKIATSYGAAGVILYSDPKDYAWGKDPRVYPDDWWLPGSGVQRGSILMVNGDPLTPGYPSIDSAYRLSEEDAPLPKIPSHPIGYDDAEVLLRELGGDQAPEDWRGSLNVSYNLGGLKTANTNVHLHVTTYNKRRTTYNAVGIIRGEIEPDRYVILGNHRDAWVFGAIDPSSGTATMMEVSRVFGELKKQGWRPRRSLMFCSWGSEEYGLIGSTEWVEQYIKSLGERAVAYLNVDISVHGNYSYNAGASPLLYDAIYKATKKVPNPNPEEKKDGRATVYDTYLNSFEDKSDGIGLGRPKIADLGSGSDYAAFLHRIGVPCVDASFTYDSNTMKIGSYPLYHSAYETFYAVDELIDRGFHYHTAMGNIWAEMGRNLADSLVLPFNVTEYGVALDKFRKTLYKDYGELMSKTGKIDLEQLTLAIKEFTMAAQNFHKRVAKIDRNNPLLTRMVNDQMIQVERAFTDPQGLPGRPMFSFAKFVSEVKSEKRCRAFHLSSFEYQKLEDELSKGTRTNILNVYILDPCIYRHLVFAPSSVNIYAGASYPGIADALFQIESAPDQAARWAVVKKHYSVVVFTILSAASTLQDVTKFMEKAS